MNSFNGKTTASTLIASSEWNVVAEELENLILSTNQVLFSGDTLQVAKAVAAYTQAGDFYTASGSINSYALAPVSSFDAPNAYYTGMRVRFIPVEEPPGSATQMNINVASIGANTVKLENDATEHPPFGAWLPGVEVQLRYDGAQFLLSDAEMRRGDAFYPGYIQGATLRPLIPGSSNITIAPGSCRDYNDQVNIVWTEPMTKILSTAWSAGDGAAGGPGTPTTTVYHVYAIMDDEGTVDFGFSTSSTASDLRTAAATATSTAWEHYRHLGWVSYIPSHVVAFHQDPQNPNVVLYQDAEDIQAVTSNAVHTGTPTATFTGRMPPNVLGMFYVTVTVDNQNTGTGIVYGRFGNETTMDRTAPTDGVGQVQGWYDDDTTALLDHSTLRIEIPTDASADVGTIWDVTDTDVVWHIKPIGYKEDREQCPWATETT
jgi:hypothetical protein